MLATAMLRRLAAAMLAAALAATLVGPPDSAACGLTTHSMVAHRARSYFFADAPNRPGYAALMTAHLDDLIAGAPFPDYLYLCGKDHDAGEQAHWPPFHAAAARYIRTHWPPPFNWSAPAAREGARLVAFFLGAVSHYISDLVWHGQGVVPTGYGLIETIGGMVRRRRHGRARRARLCRH